MLEWSYDPMRRYVYSKVLASQIIINKFSTLAHSKAKCSTRFQNASRVWTLLPQQVGVLRFKNSLYLYCITRHRLFIFNFRSVLSEFRGKYIGWIFIVFHQSFVFTISPHLSWCSCTFHPFLSLAKVFATISNGKWKVQQPPKLSSTGKKLLTQWWQFWWQWWQPNIACQDSWELMIAVSTTCQLDLDWIPRNHSFKVELSFQVKWCLFSRGDKKF